MRVMVDVNPLINWAGALCACVCMRWKEYFNCYCASCSPFLLCRCMTDYRQWCNGMQQIGLCTFNIFYKHVYYMSPADQGSTLPFPSGGGSDLFPLVFTCNAGWKCHTGVTQGVSHCNWQCQISVSPSTASVSHFLQVYIFSKCTSLRYTNIPQRHIYLLHNIIAK